MGIINMIFQFDKIKVVGWFFYVYSVIKIWICILYMCVTSFRTYMLYNGAGSW